MNRENCVARARKLGAEYELTYHNDAQATFQAIIDAVKEEGITLTDPVSEEIIFRSLAGLAGGHALTGNGNHGALSGAAAVISLLTNVNRAYLLENRDHRWINYDNVYKSIFNDFIREYRGLTDKHVIWALYGKWWNYWDPEAWQLYLKEMEELGHFKEETSPVSAAAGWAAGYVLDIYPNPRTFEQVKKEHNL